MTNNPPTTQASSLPFVDHAKYFKTAWIGRESELAKAATDGDLDWEHALQSVTVGAAKLLGTDNEWVTIFHNTTGAMHRIFARLSSYVKDYPYATLLTTNVEYPGIMALLRDSWNGQIGVVDIGDAISEGHGEEALRQLAEAVLVTRPSVIFLSHVVRSSGFVIPDEFFHFVRSVNPHAVLVVDGAQAIGNIAVDGSLITDGPVDFYVTSGQKWLCGRPTLAFAWCDPKWRIKDPSQSYSIRVGSGGTGDVRSLTSLAVAMTDFTGERQFVAPVVRQQRIAEHNASLARYFCERIAAMDLERKLAPVPLLHGSTWRWSGIVALWENGTKLAKHLDDSGFRVSSIEQEQSSEKGRGFLMRRKSNVSDSALAIRRDLAFYEQNGVPQDGSCRICFHYYHVAADVDKLVDWFANHFPPTQRTATES